MVLNYLALVYLGIYSYKTPEAMKNEYFKLGVSEMNKKKEIPKWMGYNKLHVCILYTVKLNVQRSQLFYSLQN